ncbi:DNA polymerase delta catalytic subunit isoform X1 [Gossypium raimondii]|uniref:DNA polymerase delta catalytic subunit isoform X1 n=1 Tax=Gossypium raimondii TaxID=29730 RepID=UPI00227C0661|nr:DNA polymerase delta catalytic subunit isoform X1 [Gossypium raimondii]XP_052482727.1 DNA polymerase delta catalytic subunit isoform X1 [Gossypium raimondii]
MNKGGNPRKRPPPPSSHQPSPASKHQATTPTPPPPSTEEDFVDEDVFFDETLMGEEDVESLILRDFEERQALASRLSKWARPPLSDAYISQSRSIVFQQLEIDYVIGESHKGLLPDSSGQAAIIRIFGVTGEGHSVCCLVHGFEPYFYISCPPGMGPDDISHFHQTLEGRMKEMNRNSKVPKFVRRIELVQKRSIMYYQQQKSQPFLKIVVALPTMVATCRGILDRGIQIDGLGMKSFITYESNVLFALRFMIDCNIVGGNWIEIPAGKYKKTAKNMSYCQLEFDCLYSDLISHAPEGEFSKMAPFRILSFDIECAGRKGHFPEPSHDPVIQVANLVTLQGEDQPFIRNVMTLKSCSPIVGVDVMSFDTEKEVLLAWREFIREVDPDIIIGYNICKFDLPYLIERAQTLGIAEFPILGRIRNSRVRVKDTTFSSRQYGTRESKEVTVEGRVQFDLLQAMQRDYKLSSYSLNSVSAHFLSEQKEDVHHSIISDLQNGNAETRRRLAVYCLKDAYLPQRLLDKLMYVYNYVEMARVTGVPISFLLSRGQSIKVLSQLLRKSKQKNLVIPNVKQAGSEQGTFEGATVLEAKAGFYEKPIATLDFASLYPSIMMAYNLCYCTLVTPEDVRKLNLPPECVNRTPSGETFVKPELQKGILPEILEELLAARKRAKADLKEAKDPLEKAVLDGRQLALKVSANSVYGFTGATVGQLPCLEISSSVTSYGRQMIEHTKKLVEDKFTVLGGYEHNAEVIYGDTDSVMVQFGVSDVEAAMNLGREAAEHISGTFTKEGEVFCNCLSRNVLHLVIIFCKKRYAGLYWTNPQKFDKMDTKGIETVRRDNCLLVKNLVTECLHKILIDRDIPGAVQYVKNTISDLLMNRMDLSLLVITKGLTKTGDDYEVKAAHVELAERMRKRDPATAPNVGDRVPYVIIKAAKGAKAYERSEDPIYVLENNIPIDPQYYLENQISKPLLRIFEPILKNASKELLHGSHTRSISISTPSNSGIMKFAKKQLSCIGCKALICNSDRTLCSHCKGREAELYYKTVSQVSELEELFGRLWTQCQECQGSLHQDVLCTSRDCPIFYRRKKAQKDMVEAKRQLDRWNF